MTLEEPTIGTCGFCGRAGAEVWEYERKVFVRTLKSGEKSPREKHNLCEICRGDAASHYLWNPRGALADSITIHKNMNRLAGKLLLEIRASDQSPTDAEAGRLLDALKEIIEYRATMDLWEIKSESLAFIDNPKTHEAVKAFLKEAEDA